MGWMSRFLVARGADPVDPRNESASNGAPYDARRSGPEHSAAPGDRPDAEIADEIKRRQIALAVRYVAMVRAR
jgi:hypothetical protein